MNNEPHLLKGVSLYRCYMVVDLQDAFQANAYIPVSLISCMIDLRLGLLSYVCNDLIWRLCLSFIKMEVQWALLSCSTWKTTSICKVHRWKTYLSCCYNYNTFRILDTSSAIYWSPHIYEHFVNYYPCIIVILKEVLFMLYTSLIPRPLPDFISQLAVEKKRLFSTSAR